MSYFTIGQLNIPIIWLAFFAAIFISDWRNKRANEQTKKVTEQLLWTYMIIWKLSYILFSWTDFVQAPLSLIYFDGGLKGHLLALFTLAFILFKKRAIVDWSTIWPYWARFVTVFEIIHYSFQAQWFIVVLWAIVWLLIEKQFHEWHLFAQWLLIVWLEGWMSGLTQTYSALLLLFTFQTKQLKHTVTMSIIAVVASFLTDIEQPISATARESIELQTTTGTVYSVANEAKQLTIVNFFATWCPPCKAEMPHLQSVAAAMPDNIALIGVNLAARDNGEQALADFMQRYDVTYPILLDEKDKVANAFHIASIPTTVILNAQGEEIHRIVGPVSEHKLRQLIKQYE